MSRAVEQRDIWKRLVVVRVVVGIVKVDRKVDAVTEIQAERRVGEAQPIIDVSKNIVVAFGIRTVDEDGRILGISQGRLGSAPIDATLH